MRFALFTLGFGAIGAVAGAVYRGITWHSSCGGSIEVLPCLSRGESVAFLGFVGFLAGALIGVIVWCHLEEHRLAKQERLGREDEGPGGEPNA